MVRVLPTEDDGNPMIDKRFLGRTRGTDFPNLLSSRRNFEKSMMIIVVWKFIENDTTDA